jgi:hypothetical protein
MRFDATRSGGVPSPVRSPTETPARPALHRVWLVAFWPGLRMMLKTIALPLALFVGLPACLFTLACLLRGGHLVIAGQVVQAAKMFFAAWVCGTVAAIAFWPRRL